jgi:cellulose synthase/poly-beta-1,6-N-acetylglucosamine synthase-like glycosyltransferase
MSKILTIVIPACNAETVINNALMSLDYKCGRDFDVLIVDDGGSRPVKKFIQP